MPRIPFPLKKQGVTFRGIVGQVAQLVEQRTENPRVGGSIPSLATKQDNELRVMAPLGARRTRG